MANVKQTAVDILNRYLDSAFENGLFATENLLDEKFVEHLWTSEFVFTINGCKVSHDFYIVSEQRSGIINLDMCVIGPDGQKSEALTLAKFYFKYLSVNTLASAIAAIVERS